MVVNIESVDDDVRANARICFTAHVPALALTLSERASSYCNALERKFACVFALTPSERASSYCRLATLMKLDGIVRVDGVVAVCYICSTGLLYMCYSFVTYVFSVQSANSNCTTNSESQFQTY